LGLKIIPIYDFIETRDEIIPPMTGIFPAMNLSPSFYATLGISFFDAK
jgi:hypothetical protein